MKDIFHFFCACFTDAILIPSPFYGVITEDVGLYSSVILHHVPLYNQVLSESSGVRFNNVTLTCYSGFLFYFCFVWLFCLSFYLYIFVFVQLTGSDVRPFQLTVEKLENSLKDAKKEVILFKVLLLFFFKYYLSCRV